MTLALIISVFSYSKQFKDLPVFKNTLLYTSSIYIAFCLGFRDYSIGVDTKNYKYDFDYKYSLQESFQSFNDILWDLFNYIVSQFTNDVRSVFVLVAIGYIFLPIIAVRKYLNNNTIYFFLLFIVTPNFFLYGTNTIRSGLAASIILLSLRYYKSYKQYIVMLLGILIHFSMIVPSFFFFISKYIKSILYPLAMWVILLLFSISGINLLVYMPLSISRLNAYVTGNINEENLSNVLVNFFISSVTPVLVGIYVIYIRKISDEFYNRLLVTYILTNCIYIIAFNSVFAVRFAYMSEFLTPFLLVYPLLKYNLWKYIEIKICFIIFIIFLIKAYKVLII